MKTPSLDEYIKQLEGELSHGGPPTLDELFNLALAIKSDLEEQ